MVWNLSRVTEIECVLQGNLSQRVLDNLSPRDRVLDLTHVLVHHSFIVNLYHLFSDLHLLQSHLRLLYHVETGLNSLEIELELTVQQKNFTLV